MNRKALTLALLLALVVATAAFAVSKTYQVTGPVLEIKGDVIVVQKGADKWELTRDAATKVNGDLKVGSKVTIDYRMIATTVNVSAAAAKPAKKK